jgi:nucleolar protein 53
VLQRKFETGKHLKGRQASAKPATSALKDLWGTEETQESAVMTKKVQKPSVELSTSKKVAGPGFSYNPTPQAHQDALAEALALEIKKRERELRDRKPVNVMPVTRQEDEVNDSDDDDEDDDDDGGADGISQSAKKAKMKEKKTRAQRNKERRRKDQEAERSVEQSEKRLLKDIEKLPALVQSIEKEERKVASLRLLRKVQAQSAVDETAMTYEEAGAVPLSDELSGTLRRVIPKGSGLNSTVTKFKSTGAIQFRDKFKRHKGDNLHTRKRVVWVARHKYT